MVLNNVLLAVLFVSLCLVRLSDGHGRLMDPPARNSMWRLGFNNPVNYNDNELYCGGRMIQWIRNKGKCGLCGDPYHGNRDHEAGGKYAKGVIGKSYHAGDVIPVVVHLTANHQGWFEFKLCPVNDPKTRVTQKCFDKHVLQRSDGKGTTFPIPQGKYNAFFNFSVRLPEGLTCKQCVMQWKYRTGNTWDKDDSSGVFCLGCGPQEEFYNCADVEILPKGQKSQWVKETVPTTTTTASGSVTASPTPKPILKNQSSTLKPKETTSKYTQKIHRTTSKPVKMNRRQKKYKHVKKDTTSSETYLIEPKILADGKRNWRASTMPKKLSKWLKKKTDTSASKSPFKKPKETKLPSWLVNTRMMQEKRNKLMARRKQLLRRQKLIAKQKAYRRQQKLRRLAEATTTEQLTTITTPATLQPRRTLTQRPSRRILRKQKTKKQNTLPCYKNHALDKNSMVASTDMPDAPELALRNKMTHKPYLTPSPTHQSPIYITRRRHENSLSLHDPSHSQMQTDEPQYPNEYPEHPVIETDDTIHSPVHRHNLPFHSRSPFANPGNPHTNPLINYWWNQYQRPLVNLWNNVRTVLKCHGTITLGGGMDEWCTANCNANFCPGGMCVCQPQTSVYPTYSVYPRESQSWMNSYTPTVRMDTPRPLTVENPYILHHRHQQQLEAYKQRQIKQMTPIYTGHNTVQRQVINEESNEEFVQKYAPTVITNTNQQDTDAKTIIHKRSTPVTTLPTTLTNIEILTSTTTPSTKESTTTTAPTITTKSTESTASFSKTYSAKLLSKSKLFKASDYSDRSPKRTSIAWLFNTEKIVKRVVPTTATKLTQIPEQRYKASPSSKNEVEKVQDRAKRLKSKSQFWRKNKNIRCHAIGNYAGLKRFDAWCSRNCLQTICPLLICQCERY